MTHLAVPADACLAAANRSRWCGALFGEQPGGGVTDAVGTAPVTTATRPDRANAAGMGIVRS